MRNLYERWDVFLFLPTFLSLQETTIAHQSVCWCVVLHGERHNIHFTVAGNNSCLCSTFSLFSVNSLSVAILSLCPGWTCPPTVGLVWLWLGHMDKWSVVAQKEGPLGPECILDPRGRGRWPTPGLLWPPAFWSDSGCWFPPPGPGCCRVCFCSVWSWFGWHTRLTHGVSQGLHREGLHFSDQYMNNIQGNKPFNSFNCYGVEFVVS